MIYVQGLQGKVGYQKLPKVLDVNKLGKINKDGYEELGKAVDDNFNTFSTNFRLKQTKQVIPSTSNLKKLFLSNFIEKKNFKQERTNIAELNKILYNPPYKERICKII